MGTPVRHRVRGATTCSGISGSLIQKQTHPSDPRGKEAISDYRLVERFAEASLIEVRLVTGKRNQIRLQARLRGHTLVGEQRYIYGPEAIRTIDFPRQALHAWRLGFHASGRRARAAIRGADPGRHGGAVATAAELRRT